MKKILSIVSLLALVTGYAFGAAGDIKVSQKNSTDNAWKDVVVTPTANTMLLFNGSLAPTITSTTGTGDIVLSSTPTLVTPVLGAATGTSVVLSGNVTAANASITSNAFITGNASAGNFTTAGVLTATGNITGGNISTGGTVSATGNVSGGNFTTAGLLSATGNITTAGALSAASINGNVTLGASGPQLSSSIAARGPSQGLVLSGSGNGTVSGVPAFGTADYSTAVWVTPAVLGVTYIYNATTDHGSLATAANGSFTYYSNDTGPAAPAGTLVVGKTKLLVFTRAAGTETIYVDGVSVATKSQAAGDCTNAVAAIGGSVSGTSRFTGTITGPLIYNRALTAAEVLSLWEQGRPASADYNSASNTAINSSTWTNAALPYDTWSGASATGFTAVMTGSTTGMAEIAPAITNGAVGQQYLVTFSATLISGAAPVVFLRNAANTQISTGHTATAGANSIVLTSTGVPVKVTFTTTTAATSYAIADMSITRQGLLLAPDATQTGNGLAWQDTSGNNADITLPATGVEWALPGSGTISLGPTKGSQATIVGSSAGALTITPKAGQVVSVATNNNAASTIKVSNSTSDTASFSSLNLLGGAVNSYIYQFSAGYTTSSGYKAGGLYLEYASGKTFGIGIGNDEKFGISSAGLVTIANATATTSATTGALLMVGGIGINNATEATSATNGGTITTAGGVGIAKKLFVGTDATVGGNLTVSGTGYVSVARSVYTSGSLATPIANTAVIDWNAGYARFWAVGADADTAGGLKFVVSSTDTNPFIEALTITAAGAATFAGSVATQGGTASTPASAGAAGVAGTILWDANYVYVCVATNTWKRSAIATW